MFICLSIGGGDYY